MRPAREPRGTPPARSSLRALLPEPALPRPLQSGRALHTCALGLRPGGDGLSASPDRGGPVRTRLCLDLQRHAGRPPRRLPSPLLAAPRGLPHRRGLQRTGLRAALLEWSPHGLGGPQLRPGRPTRARPRAAPGHVRPGGAHRQRCRVRSHPRPPDQGSRLSRVRPGELHPDPLALHRDPAPGDRGAPAGLPGGMAGPLRSRARPVQAALPPPAAEAAVGLPSPHPRTEVDARRGAGPRPHSRGALQGQRPPSRHALRAPGRLDPEGGPARREPDRLHRRPRRDALSGAVLGRVPAPALRGFSHTMPLTPPLVEGFRGWFVSRFHPSTDVTLMWTAVRDGDTYVRRCRGEDGRWRTEAFDLAGDPAAERDVFDPRNPLHRELERELAAYKGNLVARHPGHERPQPSEDEARERLRALGYIR